MMLKNYCVGAAVALCGCAVVHAQDINVPTPAAGTSQSSAPASSTTLGPVALPANSGPSPQSSVPVMVNPFSHGVTPPTKRIDPIPDSIGSVGAQPSPVEQPLVRAYPQSPIGRGVLPRSSPNPVANPAILENLESIPPAPATDFYDAGVDRSGLGDDGRQLRSGTGIGIENPRQNPLSQPLYEASPGTEPYSPSQYNAYSTDGFYGGHQSYTKETGAHIRHPFYSYRRPWYSPGPASYNVNVIW